MKGNPLANIKTHYDNLKVSKNAPQEVIRAAYKVLSQKYHPDRNQDNPDATRIMKIINEAYDVLSDPIKRREHDLWIENQEWQERQEADLHSEKKKKNEQERYKAERKAQEQSLRKNSEKKEEGIKKKFSNSILIFILACLLISPVAMLIMMKSKSDINNDSESITNGDTVLEVSNLENDSPDLSKSLNNTYVTSFDCNKAKSITEKLICNNEDLAMADLEIANLLKHATIAVTDKKALSNRIRKQWNYREKKCKDEACLFEWFNYQKKILTQIVETGNINAGLTEKELTPEPLPKTGHNNNNHLEGVAPLQVRIPSAGIHYFVKIEDAYTKQNLVNYFIRSGDTLKVNLPLGTYNIKYAFGRQWYGTKQLFGPETRYAKANQDFNFISDGYQYNGYTVELIEQVNGNLKTSSIDQNQF